MASTFSGLLIVATMLFVIGDALAEPLHWETLSDCAQNHDEDCPEKFPEEFPEGKMGKAIADNDHEDVVLLRPDFSTADSETNLLRFYADPSAPFTNNSYCEITTPPPRQ